MNKKVTWANARFALTLLMLSAAISCRKAPDDDLIIPSHQTSKWGITINGPQGSVYISDTVSLKAVLSDSTRTAGLVQYYWAVTNPDSNVTNYNGANIRFVANMAGGYNVVLTATKSGETKKAAVKVQVNQRGIILSIGQAGKYFQGDSLKLDSLNINFRITAAAGQKLPRFSLAFGDRMVIDTVPNASSQVTITHRYSSYGSYDITFINSETIHRHFSIQKPIPVDTTSHDTSIVKYDVNLADYMALSTPTTTYKDAMFGKVDKTNKKFTILFSVAATERPIGPQTPVILTGNWNGNNYADWKIYISSVGDSAIVTTSKGKYIKLDIQNYTEGFQYRGNIYFGSGVWANAQNATPFYGSDTSIGDTGSLRVIVESDGEIHPPK